MKWKNQLVEWVYEECGEILKRADDLRTPLTPKEVYGIDKFVFKIADIDVEWGLVCIRVFKLGRLIGWIETCRSIQNL